LSVFSTRMTQEAQVIPVTWSLIPSGLDSVAVFMSASMAVQCLRIVKVPTMERSRVPLASACS
jgi:hypothetical protein